MASVGLLVAAVLPAWRVGVGNLFLYEQASSFAARPTYQERFYGLIFVSGTYRVMWRMMTQTTCEHWTDVYFNAQLEGLANEESACVANSAASLGTCPANYANHMMHRCWEYENIHQASNVLLWMTVLTFMLTFVSCGLLFLASVKSNRDIILALLALGDILLFFGITWYMYTTDKAFKLLGESGTYPYPAMGYAFYTWIVFAVLHFCGGMMFAWCKIFSKWIFGSDRPDNWVPPSQRGLLTGPPGQPPRDSASMGGANILTVGGPPGPVPTNMAAGGRAAGMPPGPVPPGMAPAGAPPQ